MGETEKSAACAAVYARVVSVSGMKDTKAMLKTLKASHLNHGPLLVHAGEREIEQTSSHPGNRQSSHKDYYQGVLGLRGGTTSFLVIPAEIQEMLMGGMPVGTVTRAVTVRGDRATQSAVEK